MLDHGLVIVATNIVYMHSLAQLLGFTMYDLYILQQQPSEQPLVIYIHSGILVLPVFALCYYNFRISSSYNFVFSFALIFLP